MPDMQPTRALPALVALLIIVADRLSKSIVQRSVTLFDSNPVVTGWLRIVHYQNPGAAFGILAEGSPAVRKLLLIGVSVLVLVFVASALFGRGSGHFNGLVPRLGLSLILGGAVGNLYDRVLYGQVTDFIEVYHGEWSFPAFNIADSAITVGAILLLLDMLLSARKQSNQEPGLVSKSLSK